MFSSRDCTTVPPSFRLCSPRHFQKKRKKKKWRLFSEKVAARSTRGRLRNTIQLKNKQTVVVLARPRFSASQTLPQAKYLNTRNRAGTTAVTRFQHRTLDSHTSTTGIVVAAGTGATVVGTVSTTGAGVVSCREREWKVRQKRSTHQRLTAVIPPELCRRRCRRSKFE